MKKYSQRFVYGLITGVCEIIPGMSATAAAIALGYYDRMIDALNSFIDLGQVAIEVLIRRKSFKQGIKFFKAMDFEFIIPLGLGVIASVVILSGLVLYVYENYTNLFYSALFGLMFAIVITPLREVWKPKLNEILVMIFTFLLFYYLLGMEGVQITDMSANPLTLFILGTLAISGMMLPAVSGSFIMLSFGGYYFIMSLLRELLAFNIPLDHLLSLATFVLGCIVGFVFTMKLIKRFLKNNRRMFMAAIVGMILGSIRVVWPFVALTQDENKALIQVEPSYFSTNQIIVMALLTVLTFAVFTYLNFKTDRIGQDM
jgi:putative membrane protein